MADNQKMEALARRYVDLWQEHLLAVAADPETISAMARLVALAGTGLEAHAALWQQAWSMAVPADASGGGTAEAAGIRGGGIGAGEIGRGEIGRGEIGRGHIGARPATGPTAVIDPSDDRGGDMARLAARLAAVEDRIAAMEAGASGPRGATRGRTRRRPAK